MIRYLLDSNILSEPVRRRPYKHLLARLEVHSKKVAIPSLVWHELLYGVQRLPKSRKREYLAHYLYEVVRPTMPVLSFDAAAATWLAGERARLEALGQTRPLVDGVIAAVAATRSLILVTRNTTDFSGYEGLHIENWFESRD